MYTRVVHYTTTTAMASVTTKGKRGRWVLSGSTAGKAKWCRGRNGKWDGTKGLWSFPHAEFDTCEHLERLYNAQIGILTEREKAVAAARAFRKKKEAKVAAYETKWLSTLHRTDTCVKVEIDISGGINSTLEFVGYVTTPSDKASAEYMPKLTMCASHITPYGICYYGGYE